jgi:hypothetical protein
LNVQTKPADRFKIIAYQLPLLDLPCGSPLASGNEFAWATAPLACPAPAKGFHFKFEYLLPNHHAADTAQAQAARIRCQHPRISQPN